MEVVTRMGLMIRKRKRKTEFVKYHQYVEEFVSQFVENRPNLVDPPMWAEKRFDIVNDERFVFEIGMDRGISLYFDQKKLSSFR